MKQRLSESPNQSTDNIEMLKIPKEDQLFETSHSPKARSHIISRSKSLLQNCIKICLILLVQYLAVTLLRHFSHAPQKSSPPADNDPPIFPKQSWQDKLRLHISKERPALYEKIFLPPSSSIYHEINLIEQHFISNVCLSVLVHNPDHLNIILRDCDNTRWELPFEEPYAYPQNSQYLSLEKSNFEFVLNKSPFSFEVKRKSTQETIYKWTQPFVFTDNYLEFSFETPTNEIYGLGERSYTLQFHPGKYSLFIMDRTGDIDNGTPGHNTQGHHPVYLMKEKSGNYHMNLLRNINSGEFALGANNNITWQLIGGIVDLNFFLGDKNPENVVQTYHRYVGGWGLPAFWAMGYQQHKWWGYKDINQLSTLIHNFTNAKLPVDTIFSDIEFLRENINFHVDEEHFPYGKVWTLFQDTKKRSVCVVGAFIPFEDLENPVYSFPNMQEIALHESNNNLFVGGSFGGPAYIPDYTHPRAEEFWREMLRQLEQKWPISGFWLDANEMTAFRINTYPDRRFRKYGNLPFYPGNNDLYVGMFMPPPDAIHADGTEEFDIRGITGLLQCKYTYNYLREKHPFPFVLTRSTMFGSGKFALHWLADYGSTWDHMRCSIGTLSTFNIFGMAFVGTDVCGFLGHTRVDPQMCARWYQLGTFYPYTKNGHAPTNEWYNSQEPFTFDGIIFETISASIHLRYSLLKYFYTLFFLTEGSELRIGTVFRPLFFEFYDDPNLPPYGSTTHEDQFLIGRSVMVAPVLKPDLTEINVYFPNSRWYDLRNFQEVSTRSKSAVVEAKLPGLPPFFLRGGGIFFQQNTESVWRTEDLDNRFKLVIGLDDFHDGKSQATGFLLGVNSYDEHTVFDECVKKNCMLKITAECEIQETRMIMRIHISQEARNVKSTSLPSELVVFKVYVMGLPSERVTKYSSVNMEGQKGLRTEKSENTIILDFESGSELKLAPERKYSFAFV